MSADPQTHRRAAAAALSGLVAQGILSGLAAVLGLWARGEGLDWEGRALSASAWYLLSGLPIWAMLWVIYHQHRLERAESLEAEQLSRTDARTAAIFESHAEDLRVARARLERLNAWGLPAVSFLVSAFLLVTGLVLAVRYSASLRLSEVPGLTGGGESSNLVLLAASVAAAFVAFIVARYVAGMTSQPHWQLLRGGAGTLMGGAVALLLMVVGAGATLFFTRAPMAVVAVVIPSGMALVGAEMLLALLLGFYRPRKPGETPRPAFDSRLLGWLTRPESLARIVNETINYQFGIEVSRSWFYRLLSRALAPLVACAIVTLLLLSALVTVGPQEQAIITVNGRISMFSPATGQAAYPPGLHVKWPWPIGRVTRYEVGRVQQMMLGSVAGMTGDDAPILWTQQHTVGAEDYLVTGSPPRQKRGTGTGASPVVGPDLSLIGAQVMIQYVVRDLKQWVLSGVEPAAVLQAIAERRINTYFLSHEIDSLLTGGRNVAGDELRGQIQADVDAGSLGVEIVFVGLAGVHPPMEEQVAEAFHKEITARLLVQSSLDLATQKWIESLSRAAGSPEAAMAIDQAFRTEPARGERLLMQASGEAARIVQQARADAWDRIMDVQTRAAEFTAQLQAFRNAPRYFAALRYHQALAEGMAKSRKIIMASPMTSPPVIDMDLTDTQVGLESILPSRKP